MDSRHLFSLCSGMPVPETLALYPYVIVRLGCTRCARRGQYRLARLAAKYGSEITLDTLIGHLAGDCSMYGRQRHPFKESCGAHFLDVGGKVPPDLPPAARALRVVK